MTDDKDIPQTPNLGAEKLAIIQVLAGIVGGIIFMMIIALIARKCGWVNFGMYHMLTLLTCCLPGKRVSNEYRLPNTQTTTDQPLYYTRPLYMVFLLKRFPVYLY